MDFSRFVDVPFSERGRNYDGADCWGLVFLFYRDILGIDLPLLSDRYEDTKDRKISDIVLIEKSKWTETSDPKPGDVVLILLAGRPAHVGIYAGRGKMIHVMTRTNSIIESLKTPKWKHRIEGFYEFKRQSNSDRKSDNSGGLIGGN